jgi:phosphinothricin acetyltransferase
MNQPVIIRPARFTDLPVITEIYNEAILTTTATCDTELKSTADMAAWLTTHDARHPVIVAEIAGDVVGWASLSQWSNRPGYADTAEASVYVHSTRRGQGIGQQLLETIVVEGERVGLHTLIARVETTNQASLGLAQAAGFESIGIMREVGRKFGRLLDIHLLQKIYS